MSNYICPVCGNPQNCDQAAYNHHVESHFADSSSGTANSNGDRSAPSKRPISEDTERKRDVEGDSSYCPMCDFPLSYLSMAEAQTHVNTCLDSQSSLQVTQTNREREPKRQRTSSTVSSSEVGGDVVLNAMDEDDINAQRQRDDLFPVDKEWQWDGPAKPGGWTQWVGKKVHRGDKWWDPINGKTSEVPSNLSPGVIPILAAALRNSHQKGITRRAVLCSDTVHMKGVLGFDMGWGCGYRNALMALSALLLTYPAYRPLFSAERNGAQPGVRRVQGWLEEAWSEGYDPDGRVQFKGKVLGTRRWIGPSDLYAVFSYKGIPCRLYDFPTVVNDKGVNVSDAHTGLQKWVKQYFTEDELRTRTGNAFDTMMRGQEDAVRISTNMPIILQHSGHSRTIIGYEETSKGDINLLLFDPGKAMPKELRKTAIHRLDENRGESSQRPPLRHARSNGSANASGRDLETMEGIPFSPPYTDGQGNPTYTPSEASTTNTNVNANNAGLRSDEEMTPSGWIKKKVSRLLKSPLHSTKGKGKGKDVMKHFRVSTLQLCKYSQYQILVFPTAAPTHPTHPTREVEGEGRGSILSFDERQRRKIPRSQLFKSSVG